MFISERVNCSDQISRGRPGGAVQKEDAAVAAANGFHCERHTKTVNTGDYLSAASMKGTSGGLSTTAERYWEGTTLYTYTTLRGKGFSCTGREIDLIYARRTGAELPIKSLPIIVHPPPPPPEAPLAVTNRRISRGGHVLRERVSIRPGADRLSSFRERELDTRLTCGNSTV